MTERALAIAAAGLNDILARWLDFVPETAELDCAFCVRAGKCCAFQPFLANFLAGALLAEGRSLPDSQHVSLAPLGVLPSPLYRRRHANTPEAQRGWDLLCAFYDQNSGGCSIWHRRPGECSSYLCTTSSPARADLSQRAFAVETGLAQMALAQLGFSARAIARQIDILNDSEQAVEAAPGRDEVLEIYRASWEWARGLSREEVHEFIGAPGTDRG